MLYNVCNKQAEIIGDLNNLCRELIGKLSEYTDMEDYEMELARLGEEEKWIIQSS